MPVFADEAVRVFTEPFPLTVTLKAVKQPISFYSKLGRMTVCSIRAQEETFSLMFQLDRMQPPAADKRL